MFKRLSEKFLKPVDTNDQLKLVRPKMGRFEESRYQVDGKGIIEMDLFMMPAYHGYKYYALFVDIYTRQLFVWTLKDKSAKSLLNAVEKSIQFYGTVHYFFADGGGEFKNNAIINFLEEKKIPIRYSMTNRNANSIVEAYGGIIKKFLNELTAVESLKKKEYDLNWVDDIEEIVREINKINKENFPKPMFEQEWSVPNPKGPQLGEMWHVKIDQPRGLLNNKKLHGDSMRYGDLHFSLQPKEIVGILPRNDGPTRYLVSGIPETSFSEKELIKANEKLQKKKK